MNQSFLNSKNLKLRLIAFVAVAILGICLCVEFILNNVNQPISLKWAKNLQAQDVESIELIRYPNNGIDDYRKFELEDYSSVTALLNQSHGKHIENPEPIYGGGITFRLVTQDGVKHTISNNSNVYLIIDGDCYDASNLWLSNWKFSNGDAPIPETFYDKNNQVPPIDRLIQSFLYDKTNGLLSFTIPENINSNFFPYIDVAAYSETSGKEIVTRYFITERQNFEWIIGKQYATEIPLGTFRNINIDIGIIHEKEKSFPKADICISVDGDGNIDMEMLP